MIPLLVLRPEPGGKETARRAEEMGLEVIACPLFAVEPVAHSLPDAARFDAVLLTSANGARHGGDAIAITSHLPFYAVGKATAQASGRDDAIVGPGDIAGTLPLLHEAGHRSVLHICGAEVRPYDAGSIVVERLVVYRTIPREEANGELAALADRALCALVHSPRAGARFAALTPAQTRARVNIVAISDAVAGECGSGWHNIHSAREPSDEAMLALAARICQDGSARI